MEEKVKEKKVTATEVAEELQYEQMECVNGGVKATLEKDRENREVLAKEVY